MLITTLPLIDIVGPLTIGLCTAISIVLANIAAGIGIAGISNSIIHCSLVIVTTFNYFVFNQDLSLRGEVTGNDYYAEAPSFDFSGRPPSGGDSGVDPLI